MNENIPNNPEVPVNEAKNTAKAPKKVSLSSCIMIAVTSVLLAVVITLMSTVALLNRSYKNQLNSIISQISEEGYYTLEEVKRLFASYYIGDLTGLTDSEIIDALVRAYIQKTGDAYAYYWNKDELIEYNKSMEGEGVGIGVFVNYSQEENAIYVLYVYENSPAEKAGLLPGDLIVAVEGEKIADIGYEGAVLKIKGDVGTTVSVTVLRDGEEKEISATREEFTTVSVVSKMLSDEKTGYIRILQFDGTTVEQFAKAYLGLEKDGAQKFVFDVRDNPGGALDSVMGVLSFLLGDDVPLIEVSDNNGGIIIQNSSRKLYCKDEYSSSKTTVHDKETVVLVNENTASAGELFTAVMNGEYATLGNKTYGKGVMQRTYMLPNGGAIKLTFAKYTAPGVENYDGVGITPDIQQPLSDDVKGKNLFTLTEEQDTQLQRALKELYGEH